jgi:hypothetical protein
MKVTLCVCLSVALVSIMDICAADTPISMPTRSTFCSSSGRYCAESNASDSLTVVRDQTSSNRAIAWSTKVFVADGFISDDGKVIASCYPGKNLVPSDADLKFTVVKLFDEKGRYKTISLGDIYKSMDELPATVSHKDWGWCIGFNSKGFGVKRSDGSEWRTNNLFGVEPLN